LLFIRSVLVVFAFQAMLLSAQEQVTLQLKWLHQFQFAGYYAALEKGYYDSAGLSVTIKEAKQGENIVQKVLSGSAEYGVGTSELLLTRAKGSPVVVLGVVFQHSPLCFMFSRTKPIHTLHDIEGKKVMVEEGTAELFAYLNREKINKNKLTLVEHNFDVADLISGKVDAMSVYSTVEPYYLAKHKIPFVLYSPREGGIDFYGDNLFTSEKEIVAHPLRVEKFKEASFRGWEYAMSHKEEIIELMLRKYNNSQDKTREQLEYEAEQMTPLIYHDVVKIGYMHEGRWKHIADTYKELGMLSGEINLKDFMYDPDITKFTYKKELEYVLLLLAALTCAILVWNFLLRKKVKQEVDRNISQSRLMFQQSKQAELGSLIANISHQWRDGIAKVGYINLRLIVLLKSNKEISTEILEKSTEDIGHTLDFMSETMQNFLDFYKTSTRVETFCIYDSIKMSQTIIDPKIKNNGAKIHIEGELNATLTGIKNEWMQVWLNLINNSINAAQMRGIEEPTITIHISDSSIEFQDNSGGIDDALLAEIGIGSQRGLGIKISKDIVKKYGKELSVRKIDGGTSFSIT